MQSTEPYKLYLSQIAEKQAISVIITTGHVSHGKTTLTYQLTGTRTQKHQEEIEKNGTRHLGYANFKMFYDPSTGCIYPSRADSQTCNNPKTGTPLTFLTHISIGDCPGHHDYMKAMLNGTSLTKAAIVVIAGNEPVPQLQTFQHLLALNYAGINKYIIVHNKLDLLMRDDVLANRVAIDTLLKNRNIAANAQHSPIIPISAALNRNITNVCEEIYKITKPEKYVDKPARMNIVRSFNVNKPNTLIENLVGAVVGGTLSQGVLSIGDLIEIRPGVLLDKNPTSGPTLQPIVAKVTSLNSESYSLENAIPGGFIGVGLSIDAGLSAGDNLVGYYLGHIGTLPPIYNKIKGRFHIIKDLAQDITIPEEGSKIALVSNGATITGTIISKKKKIFDIKLDNIICNEIGAVLALVVGKRLIGTVDLESGSLDNINIKYPLGTDLNWKPRSFEIIDDLPKIDNANGVEFDDCLRDQKYSELLQNIKFRSTTISGIKIPPPEISVKNRMTYISNISDIANKMKWDTITDIYPSIDIMQAIAEFIMSHVEKSKARIIKHGDVPCLMMEGVYRQSDVTSLVRRFIELYKCDNCTSYRTYIVKKSKGNVYIRTCTDCKAFTSVELK